MPETITVPVPQGVTVPDDAVQVPNSFAIWRTGATVHAVTPDGQYLAETLPDERQAVLLFLHFAYMH